MKANSSELLDHYFANFLTNLSGFTGAEKETFYEIVSRLSESIDKGDSCLPLTQQEKSLVVKSNLVAEVGTNSMGKVPLVLSNSALYLHKYFLYESRMADQLHRLTKKNYSQYPLASEKMQSLDAVLNLLFPAESNSDNQEDLQRTAATLALSKSLLIISGGPGTGKTSTVVKILALLLWGVEKPLKIGLAAPTGKAAVRLSESITNSVKQLQLFEEAIGRPGFSELIPASASTLHRLLGVGQNSSAVRHHQSNSMVWDVVVVDEASMVDLAMMSKLIDALKEGAQLILLGDKDQLASVESGAVLGDLVSSLDDNSILLQKSYRFDTNIKQLAEGINAGDEESVWQMLRDRNLANISLLEDSVIDYAVRFYSDFLEAARALTYGQSYTQENLKELFVRLNRFRLLCAVHSGANGVAMMNRNIEQQLIASSQKENRGCTVQQSNRSDFWPWYTGRPVLVTKNDYGLELFNGDVGIALPSLEGEGYQVWFEKADGSISSYLPSSLPPHETVYAMTIHKSQGSEFEEVVVLLPPEENRVLCRELIYTGVTRAKEAVRLVTTENVLNHSLRKKSERYSGLQGYLTERR